MLLIFLPFGLRRNPVWRDSSNVKRERAVGDGYGIERMSSDSGILLGIILNFCHFLSVLKGLTLLEIFRTLEALARLEVVEVGGIEKLMLVCPPRYILLPLRYRMMRIVGVTIGLSIRIDSRLVGMVVITLPPIIDTLE